MNIINRIILPALLLLGSIPASAATIFDVTTDAYKYVNTDSTFMDASFSTNFVSEAWLWTGASTNIAGEGQDFEDNLNQFFDDNGQAASNFSFNTAVKTGGTGPYEYPINSPIGGILLKQAQASFLVLFSTPISQLYWNTNFVAQGGAGDVSGTKISHYVVIDRSISEVPVPAALWLFAPALLGFLGLRKKQK